MGGQGRCGSQWGGRGGGGRRLPPSTGLATDCGGSAVAGWYPRREAWGGDPLSTRRRRQGVAARRAVLLTPVFLAICLVFRSVWVHCALPTPCSFQTAGQEGAAGPLLQPHGRSGCEGAGRGGRCRRCCVIVVVGAAVVVLRVGGGACRTKSSSCVRTFLFFFVHSRCSGEGEGRWGGERGEALLSARPMSTGGARRWGVPSPRPAAVGRGRTAAAGCRVVAAGRRYRPRAAGRSRSCVARFPAGGWCEQDAAVPVLLGGRPTR